MKFDSKLKKLEKLSLYNRGGYNIIFDNDTWDTLNRQDTFISCISEHKTNIKKIVKNTKDTIEASEDFFVKICNSLAKLNKKCILRNNRRE